MTLLNKSYNTLHNIAFLLAGMSVLGFFVGFLRDRAFAHFLGTSEILDIYVASFRIPDLLFLASTGIISLYALIIFFEEKDNGKEKQLKNFINTSFYFLLTFLTIGGTILFFAIPYIAQSVFQSFDGDALNTFILFSRIFLLQAILFSVATFFTAILQFKRKFFIYSLLAIIYNFGIILGTIFLYPLYGEIGLVLGVLLGALSSFIFILVPSLIKNKLLPTLSPKRDMISEVWRMIRISLPRASISISSNLGNIFIFALIISISEGLLSIYYFSETLYFIPFTIFALSYSVASFPLLVRYFIKKDINKFILTLESAIKQLFLFIIPSAVLIFVFREEIVSLLFETGTFTSSDVKITSSVLGLFVFNLLSVSLVSILLRAFFASRHMYRALTIFLFLTASKVFVIYLLVTTDLLNNISGYITNISGITEMIHIELFAVVFSIILFETLLAIGLFVLLTRIFTFPVWRILISFVQHITSGVVMGITMILLGKKLFTDGVDGSLESIFYIIIVSVLGGVIWYGILRVYGNKEIILLQKGIIDRIWRI